MFKNLGSLNVIEQFQTNIKMIGALSFVPIEDTSQTFGTLAVYYGEEEQAVLDYFKSTYIESYDEEGDYSQCSHTNSGI